MDDLRELYQQLILDHNQRPQNFHVMENANAIAEGHNPLCGDEITLYLNIVNNKIVDTSFQGKGCAISKASTSIMTTMIKGKTIVDTEKLFHDFHALITTGKNSEHLGKLAVLAGVHKYPARVKCAVLSWHTLHNALMGKKETTTTE